MLHFKIRNTAATWLLMICFYLLLFYNPLSVIPIFAYTDEAFALLGILLLVHRMAITGKLVMQKVTLSIILAFCIFVLTGLLANFIFQYQRFKSVLVDLFTTLKYFFGIITGYELFLRCGYEQTKDAFLTHAKVATIVLFALFLVDQIFHVFESDRARYGLRVAQLMYGHPTYLASAMVFLLTILTVFYKRNNGIFIILACVLLFFTLRSKAIAGVAAYGLIFFFVLHRRKKIRFWHILIIGFVAFLVAQDQILYYFVEMKEESARAALTATSFQILKDYFPIGTGFGTFASSEAVKSYSQVYFLYNMESTFGLTEQNATFASDTFWPIILGQTGAIGTICYVYVLVQLFRGLARSRNVNHTAYAGGVFAFAYLLISSTSESAFCNPSAVSLAVIVGFVFAMQKSQREESQALPQEKPVNVGAV